MRVDRQTFADARKRLEAVLQAEYHFSPPVEREMRKKRAYPISDATEIVRKMDEDLTALLASDNERDRLLARMSLGSSQASLHLVHSRFAKSGVCSLESFAAAMRLYDQASQQGRCAWVWMGTMLYSITLSSLVWCKARGPNGTFSDTDAVLAPAIEKAKHSRPMLELVHSHLQNLEVPRARLVPPIVITATRPAKERVDHLIRLLRLCHFKCHGLTALYKDFCNDTDSTLLWVALSSCGLGEFRELRSLSGALYHVERPQEEAAEPKTDHLDTQELLARTQDFADSMEDFWNALPAAEPDSILQHLESIRKKTQYWEWFSDLPAIQPLSPDS